MTQTQEIVEGVLAFRPEPLVLVGAPPINRSHCHRLMSSPSRAARPAQAARRAATPRLTWANGSRAGPAAARGHRPPWHRPVRRAHQAVRRRSGPGVDHCSVQHVEPFPPERGPGLLQPHHSFELYGRLGPVEVEVFLGDLLRQGDLALLGHGVRQPRHPVRQRVHDQRAGDGDHFLPERREADLVIERHRADRVNRTGVETLLDLHQADASLVVTGEDGPLDGGGATPARQQREMEVHHRHPVEQSRRDDPPKATTTASSTPASARSSKSCVTVEAELGCRRLHRARRRLRAAAPPAIGPGDTEGDVVARRHEGAQRRDGDLRGAEVSNRATRSP